METPRPRGHDGRGFVPPLFRCPTDALAVHQDALAVLGERVVEAPGARVLETGRVAGLSACHAEFVVAARALGVPLVTADSGILEAASDVARPLA